MMAHCSKCIDEVPQEYIQRYRTIGESPAAYPGASVPLVNNKWLWLAGGFALGCVATVIFVNVSGETSFTGLARKTGQYAKKGYADLDRAWGK